MKNYLLLFFTFLLLVSCASQFPETQDPDNTKNTFIYIMVLENIPATLPKDKTIYDYIQLFDNHGNFAINNKDSIEKFTSPVFKTKKVKWKKSKGDSADKISKIEINAKKGSKNFLKDRKIINNGIEFKVKTKNENGDRFKSGEIESYNIEITINGTTYTIDPALEYHPDQ